MIYPESFVTFQQKPGSDDRFLIVGDVHGQMEMLERLMKLVGYSPVFDHVVCVGDLIDRGPASGDVLKWFAGGVSRTSLTGNHEALMVDAEIATRTYNLWMGNGGDWSLTCDPLEVSVLRRLANWFPLAAEIHLADERLIGIVHAEVPPGRAWKDVRRCGSIRARAHEDWSDSLEVSLVWGRQRYFVMRNLLSRAEDEKFDEGTRTFFRKVLKPITGVDLVFAGHTIMKSREPMRAGNHVFIDTGAYEKPDGRLTAVDPAASVYWQVGHGADATWGPLPMPEPFEKGLPSAVRSALNTGRAKRR